MPAELFIDFDGVLCDSLPECLASSWYAYFVLHKRERPARIPLETRRRFSALRPFVRSGGDYVLIQELIDRNIEIASQAEFDACLDAGKGKSRMEDYSSLFYAARAFLLETDASSWVRLNPLYPHVRPRLPHWCASPRFFILSTKQPAYIARILAANRIGMPGERILLSPSRGKLDMIRRRLRADASRRAVLVDDQLDHLIGNRDPRIAACLASWGYVLPQWLIRSGDVQILRPEGFTRLVDDCLDLPRSRD